LLIGRDVFQIEMKQQGFTGKPKKAFHHLAEGFSIC
jgi:hypothetical protein